MKAFSLIQPRFWCFVIIFCYATTAFTMANQTVVDSLLNIYDQQIEIASMYTDKRQTYIDSIKAHSDLSSVDTQIALGKLYIPFQCDSALHYLSRASLTDHNKAIEAKLYLVYLLASIGYYNEAFMLANTIDYLPDHYRPLYYTTKYHLHSEASVYGKIPSIQQFNNQYATIYRDSLIYVLQQHELQPSYVDEYEWKENGWFELKKLQLIQARNQGDTARAIAISNDVFRYVKPNTHTYAIFAYETACIYIHYSPNDYLAWLIRSAISDVLCGVCDNGSSWTVADIMFQHAELARAMKYIDYSQHNAAFFNAKLRHMQIHPLNNLINDSYQGQLEQLSQHLKWSLFALITLLLLLVASLVFSIHQNRRLHAFNKKQKLFNHQLSSLNKQLLDLNQSLRESNHVKEQYICKYLEVYSEYIQRISKMARKAGVTDPEGFMKQEMQQFYLHFDTTFLTIYRNFVVEFNTLLKPSHQIYPKQGELLTTELRIFALIRLGIDSSAKIAKLLCYSPNTIYNYRASMRNAALGNRNTFEERVKSLGGNKPVSE